MPTPLTPRDKRLIVVGVVAGLIGFVLASVAVTRTDFVPDFDGTLSRRMNAFGNDSAGVTKLMHIVTWFGTMVALTSLTILGAVAALVGRDRRLALVWVVVMAGQGLTVHELKKVFERPRAVYEHDRQLAFEESYSFPSGHAAGSLCGYGLLGHVLGSRRRLPTRLMIGILTGVAIAAIGFSRIYLAVHYLSDVLAGYCVGTAWLSAGLWWYERGIVGESP